MPVIAQLVQADEDTVRDAPRRHLPAHQAWKERSPPTRTARRSWTGSRRSSPPSRTGSSPLWFGPPGSGPPRTQAARNINVPTACRLLPPHLRRAVLPRLLESAMNTLAALKPIRAARPDGKTELCFTPADASWANPIEAHSDHCGSSPSPTPTTHSHSASRSAGSPVPISRMRRYRGIAPLRDVPGHSRSAWPHPDGSNALITST